MYQTNATHITRTVGIYVHICEYIIYQFIFNTRETNKAEASFRSWIFFLWRRNLNTDLRNPFHSRDDNQVCNSTWGRRESRGSRADKDCPCREPHLSKTKWSRLIFKKLPVKSILNNQWQEKRRRRRRRQKEWTNRIRRSRRSHQHTAGSCRRPSSPGGISFRPCTRTGSRSCRTGSRSCLASALFLKREQGTTLAKPMSLKGTGNREYYSVWQTRTTHRFFLMIGHESWAIQSFNLPLKCSTIKCSHFWAAETHVAIFFVQYSFSPKNFLTLTLLAFNFLTITYHGFEMCY